MKLYEITADCLVDNCFCHWYIRAKNERMAWLTGYALAMKSSVADGGTVDCKHIKALPAGAKLQ